MVGLAINVYIVMAYIVMAYIVMAHIVMAYVGMLYIVMAYIVMAYTVMAYIVMAYTVMAYTFMAYVVMTHIVKAWSLAGPMDLASATCVATTIPTHHNDCNGARGPSRYCGDTWQPFWICKHFGFRR